MNRFLIFLCSLVLALLLQVIPLPDVLASLRPQWPLLVIGYWALYSPQMPSLFAAFVLGVCCDVLFNGALGQTALALVCAAFFISRLRSIYILFPIWQAALALIPIWLLYSFLMFWIDGISRHTAEPALRWLPAIGTTLVWPLFASLFNGLNARHARDLSRMTLP